MSHLGDRLSALVDGELNGAERDRAYSHLASCEQCRTEAAELRALKQKLRKLVSGAPAEAAMTRRLIAMTGPGATGAAAGEAARQGRSWRSDGGSWPLRRVRRR